MLNAIVSGGEIRPLEPIPTDWNGWQPLRVGKVDDCKILVEEIVRDFAVLASLCSDRKSVV